MTQVPALPLLLLGGGSLGTLAKVAYLVASLAAAFGVMAVALAYWERIERIVALVQGYAEHRRLPSSDGTPTGGPAGTLGKVEASLTSLDRVVRSLEREAARDPLTGILNRRTCVARLESDLARSLRTGTPLSIVIFDLDNLKTINDEHGHAAGDTALRHFARALQGEIREGDWVARWGGDEFVLGAWDADERSAASVAGRVADRLATDPVMIEETAITLGSSAGVGQVEKGDDAGDLFSRADKALYQAKREGRGRVGLSRG